MKQTEIKSKLKNFLAEVTDIIGSVLVSVFVVTMIFTYILRVSAVKGESMENTLMPEEKVVSTAAYFNPRVGDIVIIDADDAVLLDENGEPDIRSGLGKRIVKRIIAVAGQTVDIDFVRGAVYVDGEMLDEPYITGLTHIDEGAFSGSYPVTVPEGYVFVLGDNRAVSKDSRSIEVGFVSEDSIAGKVFFRIAPLKRFGFVTDGSDI